MKVIGTMDPLPGLKDGTVAVDPLNGLAFTVDQANQAPAFYDLASDAQLDWVNGCSRYTRFVMYPEVRLNGSQLSVGTIRTTSPTINLNAY